MSAAARPRACLAHLLIGAVLSLSLASGGCTQALMRLPEPSGVRQATATGPRSVEGLGPWTKDDNAGMVTVVPGLDLRAYDTLVVEVFPVNPSDLEADEDRRLAADVQRALQDKLIIQLRRTRVFARVLDGRSGTPPPGAKLLRLQGEITRFDVGSRALRWLAGFGAGRTKLQVEMRFVDPEGNRTMLATADRRIASKGFFGGSSEKFLLDSADRTARDLGRYVARRAGGITAP